MYELVEITDTCYYIECPSKIGLIRLDEKNVCLIDSGNDKEVGRKIRQILDKNAWNLQAIYNTHSHADHIGGNNYLQKQTQCKIYAPTIHAAFASTPFLEPAFLYGAMPPKDLQNKFLLAQESDVQSLHEACLPPQMSSLPLPGHFFDMVGYKTLDDVVFLADCLLSRDILDKYQVAVIYDVEQYLSTLEKVKNMQAKVFVPSHAQVTEDIRDLAQYNIDKVLEVADALCALCACPLIFEDILQKIFHMYGLSMNFNQYALVGSSIRAMLSWLKSQGKIQAHFEDNKLLWSATGT